MRIGTVKWFSRTKGYGFIMPADGSEDVFVFYPSIESDGYKLLETGQVVHFESRDTVQGHYTTRVLVDRANSFNQ
ncbi:MAG: cold shock domain-containing protein [Gammaproteobacteria bacterium]|nr:cold shock domain-containing protein [Gammaproteobacteria bacterium]